MSRISLELIDLSVVQNSRIQFSESVTLHRANSLSLSLSTGEESASNFLALPGFVKGSLWFQVIPRTPSQPPQTGKQQETVNFFSELALSLSLP